MYSLEVAGCCELVMVITLVCALSSTHTHTHSFSSVKVAYSGDNSVKAVLLKDKDAKAEPGSKPRQYIEVS